MVATPILYLNFFKINFLLLRRDSSVPHIYICCMRYSSVIFKRTLVIINDPVLNPSKLIKMFIVKNGYKE